MLLGMAKAGLSLSLPEVPSRCSAKTAGTARMGSRNQRATEAGPTSGDVHSGGWLGATEEEAQPANNLSVTFDLPRPELAETVFC